MNKIPVSNGVVGAISMPGKCNKINVVSIGGQDYHLNMDLHDEFMNDFHNMGDNDIVRKYALVKINTAEEQDARQVSDAEGKSE
ncbi:hypothetical protein LTS10_012199 [Elasticomyces elasticus]|nr:hypothetical protein LTS10_012199 [Elasticomyces elasticus]